MERFRMKDNINEAYNAYKAGKQGQKRLSDRSQRKQAKAMRDYRKGGKRSLWIEAPTQEGNV